MLSQANGCFVFIESNTTGTGELFIKEVIREGLEVIFLTQNPNKYTFLKDYLIHPVIINTDDKNQIMRYLNRLNNIKAVFSSSDFFIGMASQIAQELKLIHNNPTAVDLCRNKDIFYEKLQAMEVTVPRSVRITSIQEASDAFKQFKGPVIIKPSTGSGSMGVKLCTNIVEVEYHVRYLLDQNKSNYVFKSTSLVMQEFIDGIEYSVETLTERGIHKIIGITKKHLGTPPHFIEIGHDFPAICSITEKERIEELVINVLNVIEYTNGAAHTELRLSNSKGYIIEINPRLAGGMIPMLIKAASNIDLIKELINLFLGRKLKLYRPQNQYASIRFLVANSRGKIKQLKAPQHYPSNLYDFKFMKDVDQYVEICGDFRDRLGYIITVDSSLEQSALASENFLKDITVTIEQDEKTASSVIGDTGLLKDSLKSEALCILNNKLTQEQKLRDFYFYASIDEAHLLMLNACSIISNEDLIVILREIYRLKIEAFSSLINEEVIRGTYLLYENALISKLGIDIAGSIHKGRSRNDIQETIFRLLLRENFLKLYEAIWKLRSQILILSRNTLSLAFPIYSQYQTALPGTFAHYCLAIDACLSRDQRCFQDLYRFINISPLGSGAGAGTSFAIDPRLTAKLLGFDNFARNSLDAIASKDLILRYLSLINILGSTVSRLVEDLQLWSTNEFSLITFPDNLMGGSSMMPQKRNPYILEDIKSKIAEGIGCLVASFSSINKIPFGNSYEGKTVLLNAFNSNSDFILDAINLTGIMMNGIIFIPESIERSLRENLTVSTYAAEILSRNNNCSYKEAHHLIGEKIYEAKQYNRNAFIDICNLLSEKRHSIDINPIHWAHANEFGNGPGKCSSEYALDESINHLHEDSFWYHQKRELILKSIKFKDDQLKRFI